MLLQPMITFRGIARNERLETEILARAARLETFYKPITGCRVLIELSQRHHESGNRVHVRLDITVPGEEIVVTHDASLHAAAADTERPRETKRDEVDAERKHALVAIRRAFAVGGRRLQDFARRQRGDVKRPVRQPRGRVIRLFPDANHGFLEADDGHEVYFHRSSVLGGGFDQLAIGRRVLFTEEAGEKGPQASTVKLAHRRRVRRAAPTPPPPVPTT
jgi:cold shock CspA family protein